ncbi:MAG: glutaredoxin family protein [Betaproteobacteria bacterium]|nr:glutaredoxin family protein [Betaproteobacteria bacterium]
MAATTSNPAASHSPTLTVYGREDCHLCQDMIAALQKLQPQLGFHFKIVDVDSDDSLKLRYGERVPVLMAGGEEVCHYYFNPAALDAYFAKIR